MTAPTRAAFPLLIAAAVLCAAFCGAASWKMWPPIDGDGTAYFPAAEQWSLGRPLTNPVWLPPLNDSIDGPGGRRYIYHGFLYALTVGRLARVLGGGPEPTVFAAYVIHWLAALIAAMAVFSWTQGPGLVRLTLASLLPPSMLALSVAWHGRVEPLAILWVGAACLAWRWMESPWREGAAGIAAGLLFFTSPACGVLGIALIGAAVASSRPGVGVKWKVVAAAVGLTLATVVAVWAYPYPVVDWIDGVRRHSAINLSLQMGQGFRATWLTRPELPLLAISLALLTLAAVARIRDNGRALETVRRNALLLFLFAFSVGLARIALLKTEASYNAVVWMPLLACVGVSDARASFRSWIVVAALMLPTAGLLRSSVLLASQFESHTASFVETRDEIRTLPPSDSSVTSGLWIAVDDVRKVTMTEIGQPAGKRFFVRQQANTGQTDPPAFPGYDLLLNRYSPGVQVFGWPLSRTSGGWGFAVYKLK